MTKQKCPRGQRQTTFSLCSLACLQIAAFLRCEAFRSYPSLLHRPCALAASTTGLHVLSEPRQDLMARSPRETPRHRPNAVKFKRNKKRKRENVQSSGRWDEAVEVESLLLNALEAFQTSIGSSNGQMLNDYPLSFPDVRECNAALATFGDGGDLLRALRLYFKMRKATSLGKRYPCNSFHQTLPTPTLVTFSTIMSRAVACGKPLVAIRLWNIMRQQPEFFSADSSEEISSSMRIVPDVRSANILMNAFAKLGDVDSAQDLLEQMRHGNGDDVPEMTPNLVTYNTLLDACHKAGELDSAIEVKRRLEAAGFEADARTYTTLIATVARKASTASGVNDPTLAFTFLEEMQARHARPNGMTYSALIDVCGRCRRSDLALKGLRLMLDQKSQEQKLLITNHKRYTLPAEVGAWTAAIDACSKAGRLDTAVKLFYSMPNFGVYPNTVTCGCLTDRLLRHGRTAESLEILRYMKKNRIAPSEVMYTSLMTSAVRLARFENEQQNIVNHPVPYSKNGGEFPLDDSGAIKAVEVYTELMTSLTQIPRQPTNNGLDSSTFSRRKGNDSSELFRVSLVFQEMKAVGVEADLACYNTLLKSCANAGDVERALEVLEQIKASEDLDPNDITWREMIRAAGKAGRVDIALSSWQSAVKEVVQKDDKARSKSKLSLNSLAALLAALLRSACDDNLDTHTKQKLYHVVVKIYEACISKSSYLGMNSVDLRRMDDNPRLLLMFLQAIVALNNVAQLGGGSVNPTPYHLQELAVSAVSSECLRDGIPYYLRRNHGYTNAYQVAMSWATVKNQ